MSQKLTPVEPILGDKTFDYISNSNSKLDVTKADVKEFITHAIGHGKEQYASFIAIIDRFDRSDPVFKRMTKLHIKAINSDDEYKKIYKEASDSESELSKMALARLEWNKQNPKD